MPQKLRLILFFVVLFFLQGCNTLRNTKTIGIDILVPGNIKIDAGYRSVATRYNNSNVAWNPFFASYFQDTTSVTDPSNSDSIAAEVYYHVFTGFLEKQQYFDTVIQLPPADLSRVIVNDSMVAKIMQQPDSLQKQQSDRFNPEVFKLARLIRNFKNLSAEKESSLVIDPEFGLYSRSEIEAIAAQTSADLFVSLDFFAALDGIYSPDYYRLLNDSANMELAYAIHGREAKEVVMVLAGWSFYDLKKIALNYHFQKIDTVEWIEPAYGLKEAKRVLPPRNDAVLNAADLAGTTFGEFIAPHWLTVERMYYQSGHTELKLTDKMVAGNRWIDAAKIWKKNTTNKNKQIAAKSMFNLALACEMQGEMDAAIDWAVKSFYLMGNKNEIHTFNCRDYINILARRKMDIQKIEN